MPLDLIVDLLLWAVLPLVAAVAVLIAGVQRLRGRRARGIDRIADVASAAYSRSIFPPELRGGGPVVPEPRSRPILRRRRPPAR